MSQVSLKRGVLYSEGPCAGFTLATTETIPLSQTNSIHSLTTVLKWSNKRHRVKKDTCWTSINTGKQSVTAHHKTFPCPISNTVTPPPRSMNACHNVYCCFMDTSMPDTGRLWTTALAEHAKTRVFIEEWGQNLRHCSHLSISYAYTENN